MQSLEFRKVSPEFEKSLEVFFKDLEGNGVGRYFHPHPFTNAEAHRVCHYVGQDLYYLAVLGDHVLGYGLLRGWDEGYSVPSLGIVLHPTAQGQNLGRTFMGFLHAAARQKGAVKIRLKVYPDNSRGVSLYKALGYIFQTDLEQEQLVGIINLV